MNKEQSTTLGSIIDNIEETLIAVCLALMTLITFANVVFRYVYNDNIYILRILNQYQEF